MKIAFGKYKGKDISIIPQEYLTWVLDNIDLSEKGSLRMAIMERVGLDLHAQIARLQEEKETILTTHPYVMRLKKDLDVLQRENSRLIREVQVLSTQTAAPGQFTRQGVEGDVKTWYRNLATKYHPDRGGTNEAMSALNDANDRLRRQLGI